MRKIPFPLNEKELETFLIAALAEDVGTGDITSETVIPETAQLCATMVAREPMVLSGLPVACAIFRTCDPHVVLTAHAHEGDRLTKGAPILRIEGNGRGLLTAERTALNIVQHLSGIATLTGQYVAAIKGTDAVILDTRKTTPLLRSMEKYAVACGGGVNHRMGLYDAVMIKDNHIAVAGSITKAVAAAKQAGHSQIQVECDTLKQVKEALDAGATSLLLDNMPPPKLREALAIIDGRAITEASGGVRLDTVRAIAETGVDRISIGRLTKVRPQWISALISGPCDDVVYYSCRSQRPDGCGCISRRFPCAEKPIGTGPAFMLTQAANFQLLHALALLALAALMKSPQNIALLSAAGWLWMAGILLFCGSLYWLAAYGSGSLGVLHWLTPLGGLSLMAGWGLVLISGLKSQ